MKEKYPFRLHFTLLYGARYPVEWPIVPCWVGHRTLFGGFLILIICLAVGRAQTAEFPPGHLEFFETSIRPVLVGECYECHSSHGQKKGGLVLDYREGLLRGGDSGPAIASGNAADSLLMEALRHENGLEMPKSGVKLDATIIADFEKWINLGAPDPREHPPNPDELEKATQWEGIFRERQKWWSFQPILQPKVPEGEGAVIDRFIRARLRDEKLSPSKPAEARTLARRLYYSLIGLPAPTERLDIFELAASENRENAVNELIEELLALPQFGERWARHWMDWIRYAESHGSEGDPRIDNAYFYRDYLIRALNEDIPYDQLLREHVAGDLLDKPRYHPVTGINESVIGAAHWRMVFHGFSPTDALDEKVRFTDDQINTFTKAFLGLTVSCARCHNHKFDAISQADYYALFGILGSTRPGRKLIDPPTVLEKNKAEIAALKLKIRDAMARHWLASLDQLESQLLDKKNWAGDPDENSLFYPFQRLARDEKLKPAEVWSRVMASWKNTPRDAEVMLQFNLAGGDDYRKWFRYGNGVTENPVRGEFHLAVTGDQAVERILPSGMYSGLISTKHAGRLTSPEFIPQAKSTLWLLVNGDGKALNRYVVQNYPRSGTVFQVERFGPTAPKEKSDAVEEPQRPDWHWKAYSLDYWSGDQVHIELATAKDTAVLVEPNERSWFGIRQVVLAESGSAAPTVAEREFSGALVAAAGQNPELHSTEDLASIYRKAARESIESWRAGNSDDAQALFLDALVEADLLPNRLTALPEAATLINDYRKLEAEVKAPVRVPGIDEWSGIDQPLFHRGDHKQPLQPVSRRFLETVDATPYQSKQSGRRQLADDLIREENPFTRRVIVNRVWTHLFGSGIVDSVDNLGRLGEMPSHPEMLDELAFRFGSEMGWSIKTLIREIAGSATWQQDSILSAEARDRDPENRLLSSFPIRRLEAEAIRDKLLTVSDLLDNTLHGPPIDGNGSRRSVYIRVIRNDLDSFLGVFDAPIPFSTTGKRAETNVPAQSLTLLNDPRMSQYRQAFYQKHNRTGSDEERVRIFWSEALGRSPTTEEVAASLRLLDSLRSDGVEITRKSAEWQSLVEEKIEVNRRLIEPVRKRLEAEKGQDKEEPRNYAELGAIASWDFEKGVIDSIRGLGGKLTGNAKVENGGLVLDGQSSFFSAPLPVDLGAKTLEVLVTLDTLDQRAGGALTVQNLGGDLFDSIVFAERQSNEWMAGSNYFARTDDFRGPPEKEATLSPVRIVIAYDEEGTIRGYRNGVPYGSAYRKGPLQTFAKDAAQIVLGLRHGTDNRGGRNLRGILHEARVYQRALDADTIASLAVGQNIITQQNLLDHLSGQERLRYLENEKKIAELNEQIRSLEKEGTVTGDAAIWGDFIHSLFNLKEFIYVY